MESMIKENSLTFKEIEQKIFAECCRAAREATQNFLEEYDQYLMEGRDKKAYRAKGHRKATVKTVYGEVTYSRNVYETHDENGQKKFVYLLDETLDLKIVGAISQNYAAQLVNVITTSSYRNCAKEVSETTGQGISAMGVWNVVQALGEEIGKGEKELAEKHSKDPIHGDRTVPVLFEEADGVNLNLQGKDRIGKANGKAEMKVAIAYDGWKKVGAGRYMLDGKVAFAEFAQSKDFHRIREAKIAAEYDLDEVKVRLLNGDGASWIKEVPDCDTIFQLDPFHRNKAVREKIHNTQAQGDIMDFLKDGDTSGMFSYLKTYKDSLADDAEIKDAEELTRYFKANESGLLPYQSRARLPESPTGLEYRNMGTMENHIWSIVASRMKHNHTSWSIAGGNNIAKLLTKKCEGRLGEVIDRVRKPLFEEEKTEELLGQVLPARQNPERVGKGYGYPVRGSIPALEAALRGGGWNILH